MNIIDKGVIMKEIWKSIESYEGIYEISNCGRVKSLVRAVKYKNSYKVIREKIIKGGIDGCGYRYINLCKNGGKGIYRIAHLVYDHFGKGKRNGRILQVDHIDEDKQNNRIDNLQLLTQRKNTSKSLLQTTN